MTVLKLKRHGTISLTCNSKKYSVTGDSLKMLHFHDGFYVDLISNYYNNINCIADEK